jgi:hypothetical protein
MVNPRWASGGAKYESEDIPRRHGVDHEFPQPERQPCGRRQHQRQADRLDLLGNLNCSIANLLNGGTLDWLIALLNQLLGLFG